VLNGNNLPQRDYTVSGENGRDTCDTSCGQKVCDCHLSGLVCPQECSAAGGSIFQLLRPVKSSIGKGLTPEDADLLDRIFWLAAPSDGRTVYSGCSEGLSVDLATKRPLSFVSTATIDSAGNLTITIKSKPHPSVPDPDLLSAVFELTDKGAKGKLVVVEPSGTRTVNWLVL
jgi:hypothetical protein